MSASFSKVAEKVGVPMNGTASRAAAARGSSTSCAESSRGERVRRPAATVAGAIPGESGHTAATKDTSRAEHQHDADDEEEKRHGPVRDVAAADGLGHGHDEGPEG